MANESRYMILVADDDKFIRERIKTVLEKSDYSVVAVKSGEEALEFMKDSVTDLVIIDVHMEGISGIETVREIKKRNNNVPVIVMSGDETIEIEREARALGVFSFFTKPIEFPIFEKTVKSALDFAKTRL